jgi:hypothetical protein
VRFETARFRLMVLAALTEYPALVAAAVEIIPTPID